MSNQFVTAADGVPLAYEAIGPGAGAPVMLVHGFGSSREQNWKSTGWYGSLTEAGYPVVAMDCRGHGQSGKPHDDARYGHDRMAADIVAVMDAAGLTAAHLVGYSMGGYLAMRLAASSPGRLLSLTVAGVGAHYLSGANVSSEGSRRMLSEALLTDDKTSITHPRGRMFRDFADQPGKDRIALAACMRAMSAPLPAETLSRIVLPVLVVCGEKDDVSGAPGPLAAAFANGIAATIAGRDHMSAVGERRTRQAVLDFLDSANRAP